jgi:hypothetical protein
MSAPSVRLTVTRRRQLKGLAWKKSSAVPPGRVMLCLGRKVICFCDVAELVNANIIAELATTLRLSVADFDDVREWLR